jgi:hypothetical protein
VAYERHAVVAWWETAPEAQDYAVYLYNRPPHLQAGQTVFFKTIIRRDADAVLSLPPEDAPVTLRIRDARNMWSRPSRTCRSTPSGRFPDVSPGRWRDAWEYASRYQ